MPRKTQVNQRYPPLFLGKIKCSDNYIKQFIYLGLHLVHGTRANGLQWLPKTFSYVWHMVTVTKRIYLLYKRWRVSHTVLEEGKVW